MDENQSLVPTVIRIFVVVISAMVTGVAFNEGGLLLGLFSLVMFSFACFVIWTVTEA